MGNIHVLADANRLALAAAEALITILSTAMAEGGQCSIALSGGSTPKALYELLATPPFASRLDWLRVHVFWGDERCVPPDHDDSSYRMARESLLDYVPILPDNIHRIHGEIAPEEAAAKYERLLHRFFGNEPKRFDLILLGMGDDGHTASLFPGTTALHENNRLVIENYVATKQMWRVTLTQKTINGAANVMFLVSGAGKAERLKQVLEGEHDPFHLPAQMVNPKSGSLQWFVDQDAARLLSS